MPRYHVGIDLGTTYTALAYCRYKAPDDVHVFAIEALVAPFERGRSPLLPSALIAFDPGELEPTTRAPFAPGWEAGPYAKARGAEVDLRLVTSAKSWLGHPGVDRTKPILPWGAVERALSPLDASAALLWHLRSAWNRAHEGDLADEDVVLTVPASFDEDARALTVAAAEKAGLRVRLLEEPMAAFYDSFSGAGRGALEALVRDPQHLLGACVLVVDVGGGTTDLSIVRVSSREASAGDVMLERIAVGRHLLVGGDNIDLALAHAVEAKLLPRPPEGTLDPARFARLVFACRAAKEALLADEGARPAAFPIAIAGASSKLVGGTMRASLDRGEVEGVALEGFFPRVDREARPAHGRSALVGFGLPYERDPAIPKHVAAFLSRHERAAPRIDALLLNGGVFHARAIAERLVEVVRGFFPNVEVLPFPEPSLAVARGAVVHALALAGIGTRVGGGSPRALYVGTEGREGERIAVCVVPRGAREGTLYDSKKSLGLVVGRAAQFHLYASEERGDGPGDSLPIEDPSLRALLPLTATIHAEDHPRRLRRDRGSLVSVTLQGELTDVGTLELACVEQGGDPPRRHVLSFGVREEAGLAATSHESIVPPSFRPSTPPGPTTTEKALALVGRVYGKKKDATPREVKDLPRDLERILGEKKTWPIDVVRRLGELLLDERGARRRSEEHERNWWWLTCFCLRPGFGAAGDHERMTSLAPLFSDRLAFPDSTRNWQAFFIGWRRVAPGLDEAAQTTIRDVLDPFVAGTSALLKKTKWKPEGMSELRELVTSLERPSRERRRQLGEWIFEKTFVEKDPRPWLELARIGARVPAYASLDHVVPPAAVEPWIERLLRQKWETLPGAVGVALALARATGDRGRDVPGDVRAALHRRFQAAHATEAERRALLEPPSELDGLAAPDETLRAGRRAIFGDDVPIGLRLLT